MGIKRGIHGVVLFVMFVVSLAYADQRVRALSRETRRLFRAHREVEHRAE
jgi:hypothetical protein